MIENKDITVVIQGPIQASKERDQEQGITNKCVDSVKKLLPGAKIIISTWQGQDCNDLIVDQVLFNQDPGATIESYNAAGQPRMANFNRQVVSTAQGLKQVTTKYAIKLRADNFLTNTTFKKQQQAYPCRNQADSLLQERVVISTCYFRKFANGYPIIMLPSDLFLFGRTEDLLTIWDIPLFEDFKFDPNKLGQAQYVGSPHAALHAEQQYCQRWLSQLDPKAPLLQHRLDTSTQTIEYWDRFIASNFVILEPNQMGLGLLNRFIAKTKRPNEISDLDWKLLYQRYCDPSIAASRLTLFYRLGWKRIIKNPLSRLRAALKKH